MPELHTMKLYQGSGSTAPEWWTSCPARFTRGEGDLFRRSAAARQPHPEVPTQVPIHWIQGLLRG